MSKVWSAMMKGGQDDVATWILSKRLPLKVLRLCRNGIMTFCVPETVVSSTPRDAIKAVAKRIFGWDELVGISATRQRALHRLFTKSLGWSITLFAINLCGQVFEMGISNKKSTQAAILNFH